MMYSAYEHRRTEFDEGPPQAEHWFDVEPKFMTPEELYSAMLRIHARFEQFRTEYYDRYRQDQRQPELTASSRHGAESVSAHEDMGALVQHTLNQAASRGVPLALGGNLCDVEENSSRNPGWALEAWRNLPRHEG